MIRIPFLPSSPFPLITLIFLFLILTPLSDSRYSFPSKATAPAPVAAPSFQSSPYSWYNFSIPSPKPSENRDEESTYRASHRKTPGGPNPLHN